MEESAKTPAALVDMGACIGRQQAFAMIANKCSAAQALAIRQAKEARCHEQLGFTWDEFCPRYLGIQSRQADRVIERYEEFGETYFRLSSLACISVENYRKIAPAVADNCLEIDGESVPIIPENAARIRAFLRDRKPPAPAAKPKPKPVPPNAEATTAREIGLRLRQLVLDAHQCSSQPMSASDREYLQHMVGYAVQEWLEIGRRLDKKS